MLGWQGGDAAPRLRFGIVMGPRCVNDINLLAQRLVSADSFSRGEMSYPLHG